jgi:hypothetical protein
MSLYRLLLAVSLGAVGVAAFGEEVRATGTPPTTPDESWKSVEWGPATPDSTMVQAVPGPVVWGRGEVIQTPGPVFSPNAHSKIPAEYVPLDPNNQAKTHVDLPGPETSPLVGEFEGISQTTLTPPDPAMAVGPDHYILAVNDVFRIYDKCGNQLFSSRFGPWVGNPNGFYFDPKVFYDPWRFRWLMLWHLGDAPTRLVTAGTTTSDPTGQWAIYNWNTEGVFGAGTFADYYDIGYSAACVYAGGNQFGGTGFAGGIWIFNPAQVYATGGASATVYRITTNSDGTGADTFRCTYMLYSFSGGWDMVCFNSRSGGGNRMYIQKIQDPLNVGAGRVRTASFINIASYSPPPGASHNGGTLDTIDCRSYNGMIINASGTATAMTLFTSLNTADPAFGGRCSARLIAVDPTAGSVQQDTNFTDGVRHYWFAAPATNYQKNTVWWFSRSIAGEFVEMRYVGWNNGALSTSLPVETGTGNASGRWGDYFQGCLDWYDYYNYGATAGPQKLWGYAEISGVGGWRTRVGITTAEGTAAGVMNVAPAGNMSFSGFQGGPFTPANAQYTLSNTGAVAYSYEVRSLPTWLNATNGSGQVNPNQVVTLAPNATANGLGYGRYTDPTISFTNCYNGSAINRSAELVVRARRVPTSFSVTYGQVNAGNNASLGAQDGNVLRICRFIVPNLLVAPVTVVVNGTAPGSTASVIRYNQYARMVTSGSFTQELSMFNWVTNSYAATGGQQVINTSFSTQFVQVSSSASNYIGTGNAVRSQYQIRKTGPAAAFAWCHEVDHIYWDFTPL